jgi:hypothetical protein
MDIIKSSRWLAFVLGANLQRDLFGMAGLMCLPPLAFSHDARFG